MTPRRPKQSFTPEFRAEAVRQVVETSRPIATVARDLGILDQTLGNWVKKYREEHPDATAAPLSGDERARLARAEAELREARQEIEFLKKAAAYFAKDRR